ncbi:hypothetical protein BC833DRAFT_657879 [Globomyces pollinis-pini]|nr:hypothetical protein BC833DRAFT_657879 [Globomyces pollinis-pini]
MLSIYSVLLLVVESLPLEKRGKAPTKSTTYQTTTRHYSTSSRTYTSIADNYGSNPASTGYGGYVNTEYTTQNLGQVYTPTTTEEYILTTLNPVYDYVKHEPIPTTPCDTSKIATIPVETINIYTTALPLITPTYGYQQELPITVSPIMHGYKADVFSTSEPVITTPVGVYEVYETFQPIIEPTSHQPVYAAETFLPKSLTPAYPVETFLPTPAYSAETFLPTYKQPVCPKGYRPKKAPLVITSTLKDTLPYETLKNTQIPPTGLYKAAAASMTAVARPNPIPYNNTNEKIWFHVCHQAHIILVSNVLAKPHFGRYSRSKDSVKKRESKVASEEPEYLNLDECEPDIPIHFTQLPDLVSSPYYNTAMPTPVYITQLPIVTTTPCAETPVYTTQLPVVTSQYTTQLPILPTTPCTETPVYTTQLPIVSTIPYTETPTPVYTTQLPVVSTIPYSETPAYQTYGTIQLPELTTTPCAEVPIYTTQLPLITPTQYNTQLPELTTTPCTETSIYTTQLPIVTEPYSEIPILTTPIYQTQLAELSTTPCTSTPIYTTQLPIVTSPCTEGVYTTQLPIVTTTPCATTPGYNQNLPNLTAYGGPVKTPSSYLYAEQNAANYIPTSTTKYSESHPTLIQSYKVISSGKKNQRSTFLGAALTVLALLV